MKRNNILAVIAIIALAGCLMLACSSGGNDDNAVVNDDENSYGGKDGLGAAQTVQIIGPDELVFAGNSSVLGSYSVDFTVIGASNLIWTISDSAIVSFSGGSSLAGNYTSRDPLKVNTASYNIHNATLQWAGTASTATGAKTTLKLTPVNPDTGYTIGASKSVTLYAFPSFTISSLSVDQNNVPKGPYYNTDILNTLKTDPVWKDLYIKVKSAEAGEIPIKINSPLFTLTSNAGVSSAAFDTVGTFKVTVNNTATPAAIPAKFDITVGMDKVDRIAFSGQTDLLVGLTPPEDGNNPTETAIANAYVILTWNNSRNVEQIPNSSVAAINGKTTISYANFTALTNDVTLGNWSGTFGTQSNAATYTRKVTYDYSPTNGYALPSLQNSTITVKQLNPTRIEVSNFGNIKIPAVHGDAAIVASVASEVAAKGITITAYWNSNNPTLGANGSSPVTKYTGFTAVSGYDTSNTTTVYYVNLNFPVSDTSNTPLQGATLRSIQIPFRFK